MVKKLKETIQYYHVIGYLILAIALSVAGAFAMYMIEVTGQIPPRNPFKPLVNPTIGFGFAAGWIYMFFNSCRDKKYKKLTGRNYHYDHNHYKRDYYWLVDYFKDAEPNKIREDSLPKIKWTESGGLIFGKTKDGRLLSFEPKKDGTIAMVWGAPGAGKTTATIVNSARQFGMKQIDGKWVQKGAVMVTDLKGEIYEHNKAYRKIKRLSTIDWENSCCYDPLLEARTMDAEDMCDFLDELAVTLIPDEQGDSKYWVDGARAWFTGIFACNLLADRTISFPEIVHNYIAKEFPEVGSIISESEYEICKTYTENFKSQNERNVSGCYGKLVDNTKMYYNSRALRHIFSNDGEMISPDDLEKCIDIYIQVDPNKMATISGKTIAMIYQTFLTRMLYREIGQDPPLAFIIDEFGSIPRMPCLEYCVTLLRGYNCSFLLSCQSLSMLTVKYGQEERKIFMDCNKIHDFLSINDSDTRDWASSLFGMKKVLKVSNTVQSGNKSVSRTTSEDEELVFRPETFGTLPKNKDVIYYNDGEYLKALQSPYYIDEVPPQNNQTS